MTSLRGLALPSLLVLALAPAALLAACGDSNKPAQTATNATGSGAATAATPPPVNPQTVPNRPDGSASGVHISDEIRQKCGITEPDAFFAFDSSALQPAAAAILDKVAACFVSGPLKGKTVALVGHADPRGEFNYNMELGHRRADSVGSYLKDRATPKVPTNQVESTSQGAIGTESHTTEIQFAQDRRVDVEVKQ